MIEDVPTLVQPLKVECDGAHNEAGKMIRWVKHGIGRRVVGGAWAVSRVALAMPMRRREFESRPTDVHAVRAMNRLFAGSSPAVGETGSNSTQRGSNPLSPARHRGLRGDFRRSAKCGLYRRLAAKSPSPQELLARLSGEPGPRGRNQSSAARVCVRQGTTAAGSRSTAGTCPNPPRWPNRPAASRRECRPTPGSRGRSPTPARSS
jgi:hypothetical protein